MDELEKKLLMRLYLRMTKQDDWLADWSTEITGDEYTPTDDEDERVQ